VTALPTATIPAPFEAAAPPTCVERIVVFGRRWCALTRIARRQLERLGVRYEYVELDGDPRAEAQLSRMTGRRAYTPAIAVGDRVLMQPSGRELARVLRRDGA
jgi:mycoredoxin